MSDILEPMANIIEPTETMQRLWNAWVADRPESIRKVIEERSLAPWKLYKLPIEGDATDGPSFKRVTILSLSEPGEDGKVTCLVNISGDFNYVAFERNVFGIDVAVLEECDLPAEGEPVGCAGMDPGPIFDAMRAGKNVAEFFAELPMDGVLVIQQVDTKPEASEPPTKE